MKKYIKLLALVLVLAFMTVIAGCGSSDNFSGTWIGSNDTSVKTLKIVKNGNSYVVDTSDYHYQWKRNSKDAPGWSVIYSLVETLKVDKNSNRSATVKNEKLVFDGTMDTDFALYKSDNKSIVYKNIEYKKIEDKDLKSNIEEKLKDVKKHLEEQEVIKAKSYGNTFEGMTFNDDLLKEIK